MAKKAGAQKLQEDITNDKELETFLERPGLLVLDIYSEWCGPCLGMVGSLKKIKLESGGDILSLAICKSDTIEAFKRFRRKSEPTWLFVTEGKAVNIMFGSDSPKLMSLIQQELRDLGNKKRTFYDINEYQPEEEIRRQAKEDVLAEKQRIIFETKERKRIEYLNSVTDIIMDTLSDIGVTLFGPQVNRDMFKKVMELAESMKIQCKDRKVIELAQHQFETVHFSCPNPIDPDVLDQLYNKELLICFWKVHGDDENVPKILNNYARELMIDHTYPPNELVEEETVVPAILTPIEVKVEVELQDDEIWIEEPEDIPPRESIRTPKVSIENETELGEEIVKEDTNNGDNEVDQITAAADIPDFGFELNLDLDDDGTNVAESEVLVDAEPKKKTRLKKVIIPPIWVPNNHRTHAALIYVFFRNQTTAFLPPDPIPEPPHVIMTFNVNKKKDLMEHVERHKDDVPMYGFFTSDEPSEAKFIANSLAKYKPQTSNDKIVLKVNKTTSHTMLSFAVYDPSYVSPNVDVGHEEAKKFFPASYITADQELEEKAKADAEDAKNKKSKKGLTVEARLESDSQKEEETSAALSEDRGQELPINELITAEGTSIAENVVTESIPGA